MWGSNVRGEQDGVREREGQAQRLGADLQMRQEIDARTGQRQRGRVAPATDAKGREPDHGDELDCGDGAERQSVDRLVEADVHHGKHGAPGDQRPQPVAIDAGEQAPGTPPRREDQGGRRDPHPRDPEDVHAGEEQDGERRPQVMEDGADDEIEVWGRLAEPGAARGFHRLRMQWSSAAVYG